MKRNEQNHTQGGGYPQQAGYPQGAYPGGGMPYQGYPAQGPQASAGYQAQQAFSQPQGYSPAQGYPQMQGYPQAAGYPQAQPAPGGRSYQTPQVIGSQPPAGIPEPAPYTGQGSFSQTGYDQPPYSQTQSGYPGNAAYAAPQAGYPQNTAGGMNGYPYPGSQPTAGSYIPQTPYSQGYTSPGYQAPAGSYPQGYSAYTQMGRAPQAPVNPMQGAGGQVPLNGGGYVPQPVPVRKRPFVMIDAYLLMLSAALLALFALGMFAPGLGILKWVFIALAAGTILMFWIKPMTASNKRLCYSIVFGMLALLTVISLITAGITGDAQTDPTQTGKSAVSASSSGTAGDEDESVPEQRPTPATSAPETEEPVDEDKILADRVKTFFSLWNANKIDEMLKMVSPSWINSSENPKSDLFLLLANRRPKDVEPEKISGTSQDTSRTVTVNTLIDKNNGKDPERFRMNVILEKNAGDGQWYVDPKSLRTLDKSETPDPNVTDTPAPTSTPETYPNTVLYYNPDGGSYYHRDPNCKKINPKYTPLKGQFTFADLKNGEHSDLKPCSICGAPMRDD